MYLQPHLAGWAERRKSEAKLIGDRSIFSFGVVIATNSD